MGDLSFSLLIIEQTLLDGVLTGAFYGLVAVGLNLIAGVMNIVNVAQGDFVVFGAFVAYWAFVLFDLSPFLSIFPIALFLFLIGLANYRGLMQRASRFGSNTTLIVAFGISISLENLMTAFWTTNPRAVNISLGNLHVDELIVPVGLLYAFVAALASSLVLYFVLTRTFPGKAIQAVSLNEKAAKLMGIRTERVKGLAYGVGLLTAGIAGTLLSFIYAFDPTVGINYTLIAFVIIALGGVGNPVGAFLAGLIIGVANSMVNLYNPGSGLIISFVIFMVILLARPEGMLQKIGAA